MATPASEATAACAISGTWVCGVMLQIESISAMFTRYPSVGFITLSVIGAAVGWCLMLERGQFDGDTGKPKVRTLFSRLIIGGGVGVSAAMLWDAWDGGHRGAWMLISAMIAMFPLEAASGRLPELLAKLRGGK